MRPGDTIAIEVRVMDIDSDGRVQVQNHRYMDKSTWIDPEMIRRSETEIRKEAMEQMYEVIKYLLKSVGQGGADGPDYINMFGTSYPDNDTFADLTSEQFYKKVSDYMKLQQFSVGQLVYTDEDKDEPGIITRIDTTEWVTVLWYDGSAGEHKLDELKKYKGNDTLTLPELSLLFNAIMKGAEKQ